MVDPIDTSGPRPWPGTATIDDIRPGVILVQHIIDGDGITLGKPRRYVVVSNVHPDFKIFVVTPEQAERFTYKEIVEQLKLDGLGEQKDLQEMGISDGHIQWMRYSHSVVEGMIPERKGNHQKPFIPIELPEEINHEGLELLLNALCGGRENYEGIRNIINSEDPRPGLLALSAKLDKRMVTILVLRFGLDGEEPMTYKKIGQYLNISGGLVREKLAKALSMMRGEARRLH